MKSRSDRNSFSREKAPTPSRTSLQSASVPAQGFIPGHSLLHFFAEGAGSITVPIAVSSGYALYGTHLFLSDGSGDENGPLDLGWNLMVSEILRKAEKRLPRYLDAKYFDVFLLSGAQLVQIERWINHTDLTDVCWPSILREDVYALYGKLSGLYAARLHHGARQTVEG